MPKISYSQIYIKHKNRFLSICGGRSFVESAITRLERKIDSQPAPAGLVKYIFFEDTHEISPLHGEVGCIFIINLKTSEQAPCWLFFPAERHISPLPADDVEKQIKLIWKELGW